MLACNDTYQLTYLEILIETLKIFLCINSVRIRIFSGPHFPAFGLDTERYSVPLCIQP